MHANYLVDITILLAVAALFGYLSQLLRLGTVIGFLLAGILLGPSGLGLMANADGLNHFSELGIALLLFFLGIELKPARLWAIRKQIFGLGSLQLLTATVGLSVPAFLLLGLNLPLTVFITLALAFSSTAFVVQQLYERKLLLTEFGRSAFAILLLQDLAVIPLLALIPVLANPGEAAFTSIMALTFAKAAGIVTLAFIGGRLLLQPLLRRVAMLKSPELFTTTALLVVLSLAVITEYSGLSLVMGAFIAGLLLADSPYRHQIMAEVNPFRSLLLGLFFITIGMEFDLRYLLANPVPALLGVILLIGVKTLALWPVAWYWLKQKRLATALALSLAQSGEFSLVLFALAFKNQLLAVNIYQQLLVVALLSMFFTPLLVKVAAQLVKSQERNRPGQYPVASIGDQQPVQEQIVIAGFGRVGQHIAAILQGADIPYIAIDRDSELVISERAKGRNVYFGEASPEVLASVGAANAKVVIVTLNDVTRTADVVHALCAAYPNTKVIARAHDLPQCQQLRQTGAALAVSENLEASLELARSALEQTGSDRRSQRRIINKYRHSYLHAIEAGSNHQSIQAS